MSKRLDWSEDHYCNQCGEKMRHSHQRAANFPGTITYGRDGACIRCYKRMVRTGAIVPQAAPRRHKKVTVRDLYEQGHPCVEPCPVPKSSKRAYVW